MKSLITLKQELMNEQTQNLYVFGGEENAIRKVYYEKIAELRGKLKYIETVKDLFKELEKKSLFKVNVTYVVYNDMDFLKQKEKQFIRLLRLSKKNTVVLVYDEIPEKGDFRKIFEDYITIFNKVTDDIALKYINKANHNIKIDFANRIRFNCDNSYNAIIEEMNKYNHYTESNDDAIDAMTYAMLFFDRKIEPTPKEFADAFITNNRYQLSQYYKIIKEKNTNILGYLPELYSTVSICLYFVIYGKWDGSTIAYNAGNYWGRVKELRNYNLSYNKNDLLDIRWLINDLDINIRKGLMKPEYAWEWLIGVIL